ncbi:MAG: hypothetical protein II403_01205 [Prevotella sp.]|nr:hypothetical protein [Prevotella sp.]
MFDYLSEGAFAFWVVMAIGWVLVKIFEVLKPEPEYKPMKFQRRELSHCLLSGIHDHFTVLEFFMDENLKSVMRIRNDVTGQVVTIEGDDMFEVERETFDVVNRWRDSDYQLIV